MKKIVSILMILVLVLSITNIVKASSLSASITLRPSSTTIKPGDSVNVDVVVNNITLSDNAKGISAMGVDLEYDTNVFEEVKKSNVDVGDDRSLTVNGSRFLIILDNEAGLIKDNGTVAFTITFKVKSDADITTSTITLKNIELSDNNEKFEIASVSTQLTKAEEKPTNYVFIEGANQTYTINKDEKATFSINAEYSLFENGGKVYVDDALVNSSNYTSKSGSTIIEFKQNYMDSLSVGNHSLKVTFNNDVDASTSFKVAKQETTPTENKIENTTTTNTITNTTTTTTNTTAKNTTTTNTSKDTTTTTKILPKTGANTIAISVAIIAVVLISIVVYSRYSKMRDIK